MHTKSALSSNDVQHSSSNAAPDASDPDYDARKCLQTPVQCHLVFALHGCNVIWNAAEAASVVPVLGNVQKCSAEGGLSDPSMASEDAVCCRLYAFEAVGLLLGQEELPADEQQAYIAALLRPLIHQVRLLLLVYDNSHEQTILCSLSC